MAVLGCRSLVLVIIIIINKAKLLLDVVAVIPTLDVVEIVTSTLSIVII